MMEYILSSFLLEQFPQLETLVYGLPAWYWASNVFALFISLLAASSLTKPLGILIAFLSNQTESSDRKLFVEKLQGPIRVFAVIVIFLLLSLFIKQPEPSDQTVSVAIKLALFLGFTYLFYRLIDFAFTRMIRKNQDSRSRVGLVLPLGRRVAKTSLIIVAFLLLLDQVGIDVSAFLVGLGVGGLAFALAAQKILENLFGGAVLSLDQPFQVGDYCRCGDILGYIEEIGIRSTRIRTLDRTLVTIPNFKLSEMHIENYMEREKIRLYTILRIDLSTPLKSVQDLLSEFERLLLENENFYSDIYRIRLIGITDLGYELEIYAFAKTTEWRVFAVVREQLFFDFLAKMEVLGVKFAFPSQHVFLQNEDQALMPPSS
ncbi:MAG: mechanosensitive ion channel [Myxococcales bacterium]|nr:mechanosensitive ion channel [Myxococcales bacterium]USN50421.1 MAG: mechanosensitive ion channel [Myxococcales bacterium]